MTSLLSLHIGLWSKLNRIFHHGYDYEYYGEGEGKGKGGSKGSRRQLEANTDNKIDLTDSDRELFFGLWSKLNRIFHHGYDYEYYGEGERKGKGGSKGSRRL